MSGEWSNLELAEWLERKASRYIPMPKYPDDTRERYHEIAERLRASAEHTE